MSDKTAISEKIAKGAHVQKEQYMVMQMVIVLYIAIQW